VGDGRARPIGAKFKATSGGGLLGPILGESSVPLPPAKGPWGAL